MRTLSEIAVDMTLTAERRAGDAEVLHPHADDLLIETIRVLAKQTSRKQKEIAEDIIRDWRRTPRWYA